MSSPSCSKFGYKYRHRNKMHAQRRSSPGGGQLTNHPSLANGNNLIPLASNDLLGFIPVNMTGFRRPEQVSCDSYRQLTSCRFPNKEYSSLVCTDPCDTPRI